MYTRIHGVFMALARLDILDGPDKGRRFDIPLRGGVIGRASGSLFELSDAAVSRQHARIEMRDGAFWIVDTSGAGRTIVNGQPLIENGSQRLDSNHHIVVGATRIAFVAEATPAIATERSQSRVTMEVGSRQLMATNLGAIAATPLLGDGRAERHLRALAALGETLRAGGRGGPEPVVHATCAAARAALGAERAFVMTRDRSGKLLTIAVAVADDDPAGPQLHLPADLVDKVAGDSKAIALELDGRHAIGVPLPSPTGIALFWIDRRTGAWELLDVMVAGCLASLAGAALVGAATQDELARSNAALEERIGDGEFIGQSPAARSVLDFVSRVAPSDATVLLGGESGSGKEMVARAIHRASRRHAGPCVAINCAALTETLIESELFGHERGAFTGATERKAGRFELADKGTLFLDEVGELPLHLQTKFLRVLEDRRVERVGGSRTIDVDVRVIAASNRDLAEQVKRGLFREDLFYRLSVIHLLVPPLRERPDDIARLAEHFLARFAGQAGRRIVGIAPDAMRSLVAHAWPGNVRELRNTIERAVVLGRGDWITVEDLPSPLATAAPRPRTPTPPLGSMSISMANAADVSAAAPPNSSARSLRDLERDGIAAALAATGGNKAQAAALLEIDRSTLYKKLKDYGLG